MSFEINRGKKIIIYFLLISFLSCDVRTYFKGSNSIQEDFEGINSTNELLHNGNWKYYQQTENKNFIKLNSSNPHAGLKSLELFAVKADISKSALANNKMAFFENDVVQMTAWFYIEGTDTLDYIFLFDIEEDSAIGASPGIRIAIDDKGYLLIDRSKFSESTIYQNKNKRSFPRNKWVEIKITIYLKQNDDGYIKLWQNATQIINKKNIQTLPTDKLYYIQGTKGMYQSIQIGITATSNNNLTMYLDDINISIR